MPVEIVSVLGRARGVTAVRRWLQARGCARAGIFPWLANPLGYALVANEENLIHDPGDMQIFMSRGVYFANRNAPITIGKGAWIGPNVGLITQNHDPADPARHLPPEPIVLGEHCWIGMNAVILPGVVLGPYTTVGAGAVVTRSFPEGHCVIAGNPARLLRRLPG